jgi:hypothetical protein
MKGSRSPRFSPTHGLLGNRPTWAKIDIGALESGMQMFCIGRGSGSKRFDSMYSAFTTCERKDRQVFKRVMMSHNLRDGPDERMYIHTYLYVTGDTKRWEGFRTYEKPSAKWQM